MVLYFELRYGTRLGYASETPASEERAREPPSREVDAHGGLGDASTPRAPKPAHGSRRGARRVRRAVDGSFAVSSNANAAEGVAAGDRRVIDGAILADGARGDRNVDENLPVAEGVGVRRARTFARRRRRRRRGRRRRRREGGRRRRLGLVVVVARRRPEVHAKSRRAARAEVFDGGRRVRAKLGHLVQLRVDIFRRAGGVGVGGVVGVGVRVRVRVGVVAQRG